MAGQSKLGDMGPALFWKLEGFYTCPETKKKHNKPSSFQKNAGPIAGQCKLGDIGPAILFLFVCWKTQGFFYTFPETKNNSSFPTKTKNQKKAGPMAGQSKLGDIGTAILCFVSLENSRLFFVDFLRILVCNRMLSTL